MIWAYIIEVHICWLVLFSFYVASLRNGAYYHANRWYLLTTLLLGLILPFVKFSQTQVGHIETEFIYGLPLVEVGAQVTQITLAGWKLTEILWLVYWAGAAIFLMRLFKGLSAIYNLVYFGVKKQGRGYTQVKVYEAISPFSFFQYLFIPAVHNMNDEEENLMIQHELTHIKSWHSADRLFVELLRSIFWFSPLVWLYKQAIKDVHEFEADAHVIRQTDLIPYGELLLKYASREVEPYARLSNPFFGTQLKRRFMMMTKSNDNQKSLVRYLLIIPVMLMLIFVLSIKDNLLNARPTGMSDELGGLYQGDGELYQYNKQSSQMIHPDTVPVKKKHNDGEVFTRVEVMPQFGSGEREMLEYLQQNIKYPASARDQGEEGTVVVIFIIDKTGEVIEPQIAKGEYQSLNAEALRLVREMPDWNPGIQGGEPVKVKLTLPIKFGLEGKDLKEKKKH